MRLVLLFLFATLAGTAQGQPAQDRPNLLFILTDEQRYDTLPVYGNDRVQAPNLDRLSREGVVFRRAYVSQPVCSPARATILTGLWPHQTGVTANNIPLPERVRTLPERLDDPAYRTGFIGKWHLGAELSPQQGFQEWIAIEDGYTNGPERSAYHRWLVARGVEPEEPGGTFGRGYSNRLPVEHSKPVFVAEQAVEFLERNADRPFVLYLSFLQPHTPNFGPLDGLHDPDEVVLAPTVNVMPGPDDPLRYRLLAAGRPHLSEQEWREEIARYWGLVTQVDRSVGTVLDRLEALGLDERTIVVFTSEHGKQMGEHGLHYKQVMYEASARVPLVVRAPGLAPRVVEPPVSHVDLVPTLLDLMGASESATRGLPGRSLQPLMKGQEDDGGDVFVTWHPNGRRAALHSLDTVTEAEFEHVLHDSMRAVVTPDGWKLVLSARDRHQLFDLRTDPLETTNLYYTGRHAPRIRALHRRIEAWQARTDDPLSL